MKKASLIFLSLFMVNTVNLSGMEMEQNHPTKEEGEDEEVVQKETRYFMVRARQNSSKSLVNCRRIKEKRWCRNYAVEFGDTEIVLGPDGMNMCIGIAGVAIGGAAGYYIGKEELFRKMIDFLCRRR